MAETQYYSAVGAIYTVSGAPAAGTDEVQTITHNSTVSGGTYRLAFEGFVTASLAALTTTAALETALNNLPSIAAGGTGLVGVVVTTTGGTMGSGTALTVTFSGSNMAKRAHGLITLHQNSLTGGGSITIAEGTPGVDATHVDAPKGAILIRTATGKMYLNEGVGGAPTWQIQA